MRDGDRERDDAEAAGDVEATSDGTDGDVPDDAVGAHVVGADETEAVDASGSEDASRIAVRDELRAYRALPTLHSYLGEVGDVRRDPTAHVDLERIANGDVHGSLWPQTRTVRVPVLARYDTNVLFPGAPRPLTSPPVGSG